MSGRKQQNIKIEILHPVHKNKYGKLVITRFDLESHEKETLFRLVSYGFDIETVIPSHIPHTKNPDLVMLGTFWEMKCPVSVNEKTISTMFRKAVKQSGGRIIFDLNRIHNDASKVEDYIIELFKTTHNMYRVMIIRKANEILDITK